MEGQAKHEVIITIDKVKKDFVVGSNTIHALGEVDLKIEATDFVVIYGPSGCGKSTLLNVILGLEKPSAGSVTIRDNKIYSMNDDERAKFRAKKIGMVYQMPYWIKSLNVIENVAMPLIVEGVSENEAVKHAEGVLSELKIGDLAKQRPTQLSGGQQQRVGLARALASNPWILMADEPTGNLDSSTSDEMMALFDELNRKYKRTIIMVTHNPAYFDIGTRIIEMKDGLIIKDTKHKLE
jgi:putative ABC transport system ATP-binding protein